MRKEKNLKILPLILAAFILVSFISGCRINEGESSAPESLNESLQTAQGEQTSSESAAWDTAASDAATSDSTEKENTSSQPAENKSSSSLQTASRYISSQSSSLGKPTSSQSSSQNSAIAHKHSYKTERVDATCISAGYIKKVCDCTESSTTEIKALGHSFGEWKVTKQPTATSGGLKQRICSRCGYSDVQQMGAVNMSDAQMQQEVFRLVNEERAKAGLPALTYESAAQAAANRRAEEIKSTFSHTRPNGTTCFTVFDEFNLKGYWYKAENIAKGQTTPEQVMNSWMNSSGHRANILSKDVTCMAVGYSNNHWVQLFMAK